MSGKDEDNANTRDENMKLLFCMDKDKYLRQLSHSNAILF